MLKQKKKKKEKEAKQKDKKKLNRDKKLNDVFMTYVLIMKATEKANEE